MSSFKDSKFFQLMNNVFFNIQILTIYKAITTVTGYRARIVTIRFTNCGRFRGFMIGLWFPRSANFIFAIITIRFIAIPAILIEYFTILVSTITQCESIICIDCSIIASIVVFGQVCLVTVLTKIAIRAIAK